MINQLFIIISAILIYEFLRYVQIINIVSDNLKIYKKIFSLFKIKKGSDLRKEKLLLNYSRKLFLTSIKIFAILIIILIFILALNFINNSFFHFISSLFGILEISIVFIFYHFIKNKIYAKL